EEYEMLEERLLEALELRGARVTKCGHFRPRSSDGSSSLSSEEERGSDSGVGSSVDSSGEEVCATCGHCVKTATSDVDKTWTIKVFAANGLMRSSAWAAAWSEMERVDVEILP